MDGRGRSARGDVRRREAAAGSGGGGVGQPDGARAADEQAGRGEDEQAGRARRRRWAREPRAAKYIGAAFSHNIFLREMGT